MTNETTSPIAAKDLPYFHRLEALVTRDELQRSWNNSYDYPAEESFVVDMKKLPQDQEEFETLVSWIKAALKRAIFLYNASPEVDRAHELAFYPRPCSAASEFFKYFESCFSYSYENLDRITDLGEDELERKARDIAWTLRYRTEDLRETSEVFPNAFILTASDDYDLFLRAVKEHGIDFLEPYCSARWSEHN